MIIELTKPEVSHLIMAIKNEMNKGQNWIEHYSVPEPAFQLIREINTTLEIILTKLEVSND